MNDGKIYITLGYYVIALEERLKWPLANPNPPTKGNYLVPLLSVLVGLSTLVLILRIYTRLFVVYKFGSDDMLIIPGYLAAIGVTVGQLITLQHGWGVHVWDFDLKDARDITIAAYSVQISMSFCCLFTKLSILLSYLRFSPYRLRFWVQGSMIFITAWTLGFIIPLILSCNPPHLYWDTYIRTPEVAAKCLSPWTIRALQYCICALNIFSDVLVMVLPIPTIWRLQMPTRQKWSVVAVFLVWLIATIAACLRFEITIRTFQSYDSAWVGYDLWAYVSLEAHLAVICACAPGLKPLIARTQIWPKFGEIFSGKKKVSFGSSNAPGPDDVVELRHKPKSPRTSRRIDGELPSQVGSTHTAASAPKSESAVQLVREERSQTPTVNPTPSVNQAPTGYSMTMAPMAQPIYAASRNFQPLPMLVTRQDARSGTAGMRPAYPDLENNFPREVSPTGITDRQFDSPPPAYPEWTAGAFRENVVPPRNHYSPDPHDSVGSKFSFSYTVITEIETVPIRGGHI